jgi:hypothetical protein
VKFIQHEVVRGPTGCRVRFRRTTDLFSFSLLARRKPGPYISLEKYTHT